MPLFTGLEAHAVRSATDAGSGHPETSKEFAKRMKSFVCISGPRRAQEGGSATHQTETQQNLTEIQQNFGSSMPDQPKPLDSSSLETLHKQDEGKERLFIRIPSCSAFKGTETPRTSTTEAVKPPDNINEPAVQDPSDGSHSPGNSAGIGSSANSNANTSPLLVDVVSNATGGIDIRSFIKNKYTNNVFFKKILGNPKDFKNFEVTPDGLVYLKHSEYLKVLCIPRILINQRSIQEVIISEAHSILAHLGVSKTADYLRDHVWWKDMISDMKSYYLYTH
uniref:Integrase zinc-binding domain-containing protein n=1 Tax=Moniliophthora roreri TaxID=221103 RepID=A0A0W0FS73_MONRR